MPNLGYLVILETVETITGQIANTKLLPETLADYKCKDLNPGKLQWTPLYEHLPHVMKL